MILLLDCLTIVVSLILANYIRNGRLFESDDARMDFGLLLGAVLVVFLAMNLFGSLYRNMMLRGPLHECMCVIRNNAISFAGAAVVLYFMGLLDAYSRLVFFYFLLIDCILMLIVHQLWKKCLPSLYRIFRESRKTLLVADDVFAVPLVMDMKNFKDYSYEFCGLAFLGEKPENGEVGGMSVVAGADDLIDYCKSASLDEVIVAVADTQSKEMKHVLETLAEMGLTIHYRIPVPELSGASQKALTQFGRFYTITYANRFVPVGQLAMKRLLDLVGALVGCVFLGILTVIVGPMIKLESPGPIFFAQERVGKNGKRFKMYKFRSMTIAKDADEKSFKADTNRIFKWGAIMRATKIDELPQLLNCVLGDMAIVGPRPAAQDQVVIMREGKYGIAARVRPGLTGPAALYDYLYGDTVEDPAEYMEKVLPTRRELEAFYVHHVNVGFDLKMIVWTFLCILGRVAGKPQNWILEKLKGYVE